MRLRIAIASFATGAVLLVAGIAVLFWPAAVITAGVICMSVGVLIDIPDVRVKAPTESEDEDEATSDPVATIARIRG